MSIQSGDRVLWLEEESVSDRPKRKRGYTIGIVEKVADSSSGGIVWVKGIDGSKHVVFRRFVVRLETHVEV